MKKLLVLAMVLVFAAMPVFSELTISGEFDYYMINGFDNDDQARFADKWDKGEVDIKGSIGDYTKMAIELEEDGSWSKFKGTYPEGTPSFNYFRVQSDWGKFFGLEGIGISTDIGLNAWETKDKVSFTGFAYEDSDTLDNVIMDKDFGAKIDLKLADGLVQPYFALEFDTIAEQQPKTDAAFVDGEAQYLVGAGFDFAKIDLPLWIEAYFMNGQAEDVYTFGAQALYELAIADYLVTVGGFINGHNNAADDTGYVWAAAAGFEAFGAKINAAVAGQFGEDYYGEDKYSPLSVFAVDAEYFFLDWLGVNAGAAFAFGDYKEVQAGDETLQSFEIGLVAKPEKGVCYKLGYIYVDENVSANQGDLFLTLNTDGNVASESGLYFVTKIDF